MTDNLLDHMLTNQAHHEEDIHMAGVYAGTDAVRYKVIAMKEPLLRRLLTGDSITDKESGYLDALADVEQMMLGYMKLLDEGAEYDD